MLKRACLVLRNHSLVEMITFKSRAHSDNQQTENLSLLPCSPCYRSSACPSIQMPLKIWPSPLQLPIFPSGHLSSSTCNFFFFALRPCLAAGSCGGRGSCPCSKFLTYWMPNILWENWCACEGMNNKETIKWISEKLLVRQSHCFSDQHNQRTHFLVSFLTLLTLGRSWTSQMVFCWRCLPGLSHSVCPLQIISYTAAQLVFQDKTHFFCAAQKWKGFLLSVGEAQNPLPWHSVLTISCTWFSLKVIVFVNIPDTLKNTTDIHLPTTEIKQILTFPPFISLNGY